MSNNRIHWDGLEELRRVLRALPADLAVEASGIVLSHAEGAAREIRAAYPTRTGNLRNGVVVSKQAAGRYGTGVLVKNSAPHAFIFEHGTQARHNAIGANRGSMPPGNVFIPRVIRWRRKMYEALKALLQKNGLIPVGEEAA